MIPELSVSNIENSKKFYENIGFKVIYERKENKFCFIQLEENQIMIEEINGNWNVGELKYPYGNGINISMSIKDFTPPCVMGPKYLNLSFASLRVLTNFGKSALRSTLMYGYCLSSLSKML